MWLEPKKEREPIRRVRLAGGYILFVGGDDELYGGRRFCVDRPNGECLGWFRSRQNAERAAAEDRAEVIARRIAWAYGGRHALDEGAKKR